MGIFLAQVPTTQELLPARGPNIYPAGIYPRDNAAAKYAPPSTDQPNLIITDPISDSDGNTIMPGYYELSLSFDRDTLTLSQSQKVVAVIPVFKVEEDRSQLQLSQPMDNKSQKKLDKEKAKKDKKNKKLIREGKIPDDPPQIYTNASIKYDVGGDYYLIKYERGAIRAWGAIKSEQW